MQTVWRNGSLQCLSRRSARRPIAPAGTSCRRPEQASRPRPNGMFCARFNPSIPTAKPSTESAICRRRRPGALGVANAVHTLTTVSRQPYHTPGAAAWPDRCITTPLREPHQRRHVHPQLGNYMSNILGNYVSGNLKLEFHQRQRYSIVDRKSHNRPARIRQRHRALSHRSADTALSCALVPLKPLQREQESADQQDRCGSQHGRNHHQRQVVT
jgi:hypothetical protein